MSLNPIVDYFGIDSIAFYNRSDYTPYGRVRVLQGSSLTLSGKLVELKGGSAKFSWDAQEGGMDGKLQLKGREYPNCLYTLFGGGTVTEGSADASGNVSTLTNKYGTSLVSSVGLASALVIPTTGAADLKFGRYVVVAASATTVNVFAAYDTDFGRGANTASFTDDTLKVTGSPFTIVSATATNIAILGIKLTGGAGTIGMTTGDTATFEVRPKNSQNSSIILGTNAGTFPEFGAIIMGKRKCTGEMVEVEVYRAKGMGMPLKFEEDKYSDWDINCTILQDVNIDGVARVRRVIPLTAL